MKKKVNKVGKNGEKILQVGEETGNIYGKVNGQNSKRKPHVYVLMFSMEIARRGITVSPELSLLALYMSEQDNRITITHDLIKFIARRIDKTPGRIRNSITKFVRQNIFFRVSSGIYFINPYLFTKCNTWGVTKLRKEFDDLLLNSTSKINKQLAEENEKLKQEIEVERAGANLMQSVNNILNKN